MPKPKPPFVPEGIRPPDGYVPPLVHIPGNDPRPPGLTPLEGDIVYRYAGDQVVAASGSFTLDIDGSRTREVTFAYEWLSAGASTELTLTATPEGSSALLATAAGVPALLAPGTEVGVQPPVGLHWQPSTLILGSRPTVAGSPGRWGGPFVGANPGLMGLQFQSERGRHFGWIRLSLSAETGYLTVHGYAWRITPDGALGAGQER